MEVKNNYWLLVNSSILCPCLPAILAFHPHSDLEASYNPSWHSVCRAFSKYRTEPRIEHTLFDGACTPLRLDESLLIQCSYKVTHSEPAGSAEDILSTSLAELSTMVEDSHEEWEKISEKQQQEMREKWKVHRLFF